MNHRQLNYLNAMGIQAWELRQKSCLNEQVMAEASHAQDNLQNTAVINASVIAETSQAWDSLQTAVANCTACGLDKSRTQTVFGVGNRQAKLMIIGEAPGFNEDKQGEPFVGRAGQLLNAMLQSIGLARDAVYIANILKCRPPNNRDPLPEEVSLCTPFLEKQIALVQPTLLLGLGRIAAHYLLNTKSSLTQLRNQTYQYNNTPLIVTYHPAYLLRNPADKKKAFADLQLAYRMLRDAGV